MAKSSTASAETYPNVVITPSSTLLARIDAEVKLRNAASPHLRIPRKALLTSMLADQMDVIEADRRAG